MRRQYIVVNYSLTYGGSYGDGITRTYHVNAWCVIPSWDRTLIVFQAENLWDAGARMQKLNAREDQPA